MSTPNIGTYQVSDVENELTGMLHGTTLNQVTDEFGVYNRAARRVMEDVDPQETKIITPFGLVYNGLFDYSLPVDVKGNKIIDLFPPANRTPLDNYGQVYNKDFDLWKNYSITPDFTPRYAGAVRTVRLNAANLVNGVQINAADNTTSNGTWNAGGNANNVQQNQIFFTNGASASVGCSLAATGVPSSTGYLENTTSQAINLTTNYNNNSTQFFYVYLPSASAFTSIGFRFGSSSSAYYELTGITTDAFGNAFQNGWNLIKVPFTSVTTVGSPNVASITYLRITFTYDGTLQNQVLINQIYSRIGVIFDIEYYSKYLFRDETTGAFQEKVTDATNFINLDTDGFNIFLFAVGIEVSQQVQGLDAAFADGPSFAQRYTTAVATYKNKYKSEITKPQTSYYPTTQLSYRRWMGGQGGRIPPA